jgi:hypothetical protein
VVAGLCGGGAPLAAFREAQGLRARVIDAEEIYNRLYGRLGASGGLPAVQRGRRRAGGRPVLRYLLFAGHGGSDYKLEVFPPGGAGAYPALFPLYLVPQVETVANPPGALLLPNDPVLGDVQGMRCRRSRSGDSWRPTRWNWRGWCRRPSGMS